MLADLRYSLRQLAKTPGFTVVAIATLALAIGVNSAIVALIDGVMLRPLVSLRPEEIVDLFNKREGAQRDFRRFSHEEYLALREATGTFASVAATALTSAGIAGQSETRRSSAFFTSENYFAMLGLQPVLGRFYNAEECRPNAGLPVIVASYALWQREGGTADFVGRVLQVNGRAYTVIGIAPKGFNSLNAFMAADLWMPLGMMGQFSFSNSLDLARPDGHHLAITARLAPGVTQASLAAHLPALGQRLTALLPAQSAERREIHAEPPSRQNFSTQPQGRDKIVPVAIGFFSMSACVLVIACLNLANMALARGSSREKEIALRLALGADRWRIIRQLLVEGLMLAVAGGAAGLLLATWGNELLVQALTAAAGQNGEAMALNVRPDARVIGATFLLCLFTTLFFSLGPALKASRVDLVHTLKQQGGNAGAVGGLHRFFSLRHCLVMGQIALSLVLLFSAGLFFRGALNATQIAPGFDPAGALVADFDYSIARLDRAGAQRSLFTLLDHTIAQPGIGAAAVATFVPYSPRSESRDVRRAQDLAQPASDATVAHNAVYTGVTRGYFDAVGARIVRGRTFTAGEERNPGSTHVAIVDEGLAKKLFPESDALGQHIRLGDNEAEIVGISTPHRHSNRRPAMPDRIFVPYATVHDGRAFMLIRHALPDRAATSAAVVPTQRMLRAFDPELPLLQVRPLWLMVEQDATAWMARMGAILFGLFGAIALLLAIVGVYGVKAYTVARRTREIGIRMAIGAQARDIFTLLLKQGIGQIAVALFAGTLLSVGAGRILASMLYQVSPADPLALGGGAIFLGLAALLACWLPARRATKVDPIVALRAE